MLESLADEVIDLVEADDSAGEQDGVGDKDHPALEREQPRLVVRTGAIDRVAELQVTAVECGLARDPLREPRVRNERAGIERAGADVLLQRRQQTVCAAGGRAAPIGEVERRLDPRVHQRVEGAQRVPREARATGEVVRLVSPRGRRRAQHGDKDGRAGADSPQGGHEQSLRGCMRKARGKRLTDGR